MLVQPSTNYSCYYSLPVFVSALPLSDVKTGHVVQLDVRAVQQISSNIRALAGSNIRALAGSNIRALAGSNIIMGSGRQ